MQPLLPMLVRDQWFDTASTRPVRDLPRRSETARVVELRPRAAARPVPSIAARPALVAGS